MTAIAKLLWPSVARHLLRYLRDGTTKLRIFHPPRSGRQRVRPARQQNDSRGSFIGQLSRVGQQKVGNARPSIDHRAADLGPTRFGQGAHIVLSDTVAPPHRAPVTITITDHLNRLDL